MQIDRTVRTQRKDGQVNTVAEMGAMLSLVRGRLSVPGAGEARQDPPLGHLEEEQPCSSGDFGTLASGTPRR